MLEQIIPGLEISPRGAISNIPLEIWNIVLGYLEGCTLDLKNSRLVCQHWAKLAAEPLFRNAYLDGFSDSWSKLRSLCLSPYAIYVRAITWSPLLLYEDCLDCEAWFYSYSNLLMGADDATVGQLYRAFCRVYRRSTEQGPLQSSEIEGVQEVLSKLRNCHSIVLCDDVDLEFRCADGVTNRMLQNDTSLWETTSMWARLPRLPRRKTSKWAFNPQIGSKERPINQERAHTMWKVLELCKSVSTLTCLDINLWEDVFGRLYCAGARSEKALPFEVLKINLKSCRTGSYYELDVDTLGVSHKLNDVCIERFLELFVNLKELCIGFNGPRPANCVVDTSDETWCESEKAIDGGIDGHDHSPSNGRNAIPRAELEELYEFYRLRGSCSAMALVNQAGCTPQHVSNSEFDQAMHNYMIIDLRTFVFWLIKLHQGLGKSLKLRVLGHVLFYGVSKRVFHATVSVLNMQFSYEDVTTLLYETEPIPIPNRWQGDMMKPEPHDLVAWPRVYACDNREVSYWYSPTMLTRAEEGLADIEESPVRVMFKAHPQESMALETRWWPYVLESANVVWFCYEYAETTTINEHGDLIECITYEWRDRTGYYQMGRSEPVNTLTRLLLHPCDA